MSTHAIFRPPPAAQRADQRLRARQRSSRARLQLRLEQMRDERIEIPLVIGGKDVTTGETAAGRDATRQGARPRRRPSRHRRARAAGDRGRREGVGGLVALALGGARRRLPARRRAACRPVARHAERGDDARPVEDRAPGGDRRGLRGDRLPPLQRRVHDADLRGAADLVAGRLEPARVPAARGLRASPSRRSTSPRSART